MMLVAALVTLAPASAEVPGAGIPDLSREQRLRDQIVEAILDGEPVDLETAQGHAFLGIHTEAAGTAARGGLIILHGRGLHPDWADVVKPLRVGLTEYGWDTLAIQLPVLGKEAKYYDYVPVFPAVGPRIEAAIAWLRARGLERVVIVAHSCGSHMAQHWVHGLQRPAADWFDGFVGIGMGATDLGQPMVEPFALDRLEMPVLDVYAEDDFSAVHRLAAERAAALRVGSALNAQVVVPGTGHYFVDKGGALVEVVGNWLGTLEHTGTAALGRRR